MTIDKILSGMPGAKPGETKNAIDQLDSDFKGSLKQAIQEIDELQKEAGEKTEMFVRGEISDLHEVMVAGQKARVGMELLLEVRNRLFEGYQEIMRMQI